MAAFTEAERVTIRGYLGYSGLWLQADPRLENAITVVQAIANGGTRPDDSTEVAIRTLLTSLQTIDARLSDLWDQAHARGVDEVRVNPARGAAILRMEGRRLVHRLARHLDTQPRADVFSSTEPEATYSWSD